MAKRGAGAAGSGGPSTISRAVCAAERDELAERDRVVEGEEEDGDGDGGAGRDGGRDHVALQGAEGDAQERVVGRVGGLAGGAADGGEDGGGGKDGDGAAFARDGDDVDAAGPVFGVPREGVEFDDHCCDLADDVGHEARHLHSSHVPCLGACCRRGHQLGVGRVSS